MHDAVRMGDLERVEHLLGEPQRLGLGHGPVPLDDPGERLGVGPRAHDERSAGLVGPVSADGDDAGMMKAATSVRGADELAARALVLRERPDDDADHAPGRAVLDATRRVIGRRDRADAEQFPEPPAFQREAELFLGEPLPFLGPHRLGRRRRGRRRELLVQNRVAVRRLAVRRARRRLVHHQPV